MQATTQRKRLQGRLAKTNAAKATPKERYRALTTKLEALEKASGLYLTDECVDAENVARGLSSIQN